MSDHALLAILLALPFAGSVAAMLLRVNARNAEAWLAGAIALGALVITASFYPDVGVGGVVRASFEWLPTYGVNFTLRMDGYAWLFAALVTVIGFLAVIYVVLGTGVAARVA